MIAFRLPTRFLSAATAPFRRTLASVANDRLSPSLQKSTYPKMPLTKPLPSEQEPTQLPASIRLKSGESFAATSFGSDLAQRDGKCSGEVVFTTSLVGYPESMTDPSYRGQILVFTQPLIGNYGVPAPTLDKFGLFEHFESDRIQCQGIVVNDYAAKYSHWTAVESLGRWCARQGVPAIAGVDTRAVVTLLRSRGSTLGEIAVGKEALASTPTFENPNVRNLCAEVSTPHARVVNPDGDVHIALIDCGVKQNIIRCLTSRGAKVTVLPWDHALASDMTRYDGVLLSNGPGDPLALTTTVSNIRDFLQVDAQRAVPTPILGICMGNLVLGMAAGYTRSKLPYGNRGHNQPCLDLTSGACVITSQNHGYALDDANVTATPAGWSTYFRNANDGSNEGIMHESLPYRSVQFHPEAMGGPEDTAYLFEGFVTEVRALKRERGRMSVREVK
ncbi:Multifunctional pyrimidine synthesis protein CAD, partial [Irineochytrium annulatum]